MKVDTLEAYNVPSDILGIWRDQVGPELLPVQERAVKEFGLFGDGNLIVFSPTSSGKTFVGEMAAVKAARENTKVFYLVPQKALAAEKSPGAAASLRSGGHKGRGITRAIDGSSTKRSRGEISSSPSWCSRSSKRCWWESRSSWRRSGW